MISPASVVGFLTFDVELDVNGGSVVLRSHRDVAFGVRRPAHSRHFCVVFKNYLFSRRRLVSDVFLSANPVMDSHWRENERERERE